jgi:hypothetical protein
MNASIISLLVAAAGLITIILKWWFNPRRGLKAQYDKLSREWDDLQDDIGPAMQTHDNEKLTRIQHRVEEILKERKSIKKQLEALGVVVSCLLLVFFTGCGQRNFYFTESDRVICDKARIGVCQNINYDCCAMGLGNYKSLISNNPTIKEIKVEDHTELKLQ